MEASRYRVRAGTLFLTGLLTCCWGCDWLVYGGFLDPTILGSYHGADRTLEIRKSISLNDEPEGIPGATDPAPEDTTAIVEDYKIGAGDQIVLRFLNLIAEGEETTVTPIVSNLGEVYLPVLKTWFRIEGMSIREAQLAIADLIRKSRLLRDPEVHVQVVTRRQLTYTIFGAVQQKGLYEIVRPNFRLLEAVNTAGGNLDVVDTIYVFRALPSPERRVISDAALQTRPASAPSPTDQRPQETEEPFTPVVLSAGLEGAGPPAGTTRLATTATSARSQPETSPAPPPPQPDKGELIRAVAPSSGPTAPQPESAPFQEVGLSKWIWLNGEWVEVRQGPTTMPKPPPVPAPPPPTPTQTAPTQTAPTQTAPTQPIAIQPPRTAPAPPAPTPPPAETQPEIDWDELAAEPDQRIIRIPTKPLREGDPRYNIVIRNGDIVSVPPGPIGEFFLGGMVARAGSYSLTGRKVTLKQAIISAGMLSILAWPERCEIIRRIGEDRETIIQLDLRKIFEYKEPDVLLKPNDIVMVGTHAVTPFLAAIRNSFRMSYGFGFVYDRNFADIDSYGGQINPSTRKYYDERNINTEGMLLRSLLR